MATIVVPRRFRGPSTSGNGGYTAGLLAQQLPGPTSADGAIAVRLTAPPPLDTAMRVDVMDGTASAWHGDTLIATATPVTLTGRPVPPVPYAAAVDAARTYAGLRRHPFAECVVCGPARGEGDGLRLFPGLTAPGHTACTWRPEVVDHAGDIPPAIVWAALDCPGGWTADIVGRPMVLGTITARVDALPQRGEACVVTGALRSRSGRRTTTATSLYGDGGRALAHAEAVWVEVDAAAFDRFFAPA